jgi:predicted lipoprotein with Yx(FWY)xxD motif
MTTFVRRRPAAARAWILAIGGTAAIAFAVAGCGGASSGQGASADGGGSSQPAASADGGGSTQPAASASTPATAASVSSGSGAAAIKLAESKLGKILVNSKGQTLYLFQADKGSASTCDGACANVWPPVITKGAPIASAGLSGAKLGTTKRSDGTTEVTYNGHPLYTFVGDSSPGATTGEGNQGFGAEWDVLSAAGNKIEIGS